MHRPLLWLPWVLGTAMLTGVLALITPALFVPAALLGALAMVTAVRHIRRGTADLLAPPVILAAICVVRFAVPGVIVALEGITGVGQDVRLLRVMGLDRADWQAGYTIASVGLSALLVGWFLGYRRREGRPELGLSVDALANIGFAYAIGWAALAAFVVLNAGAGAVLTGALRGTTIQQGTGVFRVASQLLLVGAVFLVGSRLATGASGRIALAPALLASAGFWVLGGRSRALLPVVAGIVLMYYAWRERGGYLSTGRAVRIALVLVPLALWLSFFGRSYRGAETGPAPIVALKSATDPARVKAALLTDLGQLHGVAGAREVGAGSLHGRTVWNSLLWPASEVVGISGKSVGTYIVEETTPTVATFGVNAALPGDLYVNFGVPAMVMGCVAFGWLLGVAYSRFNDGRMHAALYALVLVSFVRIYFVSIDKWKEFVLVFVVGWLISRMRPISYLPTQPVVA